VVGSKGYYLAIEDSQWERPNVRVNPQAKVARSAAFASRC